MSVLKMSLKSVFLIMAAGVNLAASEQQKGEAVSMGFRDCYEALQAPNKFDRIKGRKRLAEANPRREQKVSSHNKRAKLKHGIGRMAQRGDVNGASPVIGENSRGYPGSTPSGLISKDGPSEKPSETFIGRVSRFVRSKSFLLSLLGLSALVGVTCMAASSEAMSDSCVLFPDQRCVSELKDTRDIISADIAQTLNPQWVKSFLSLSFKPMIISYQYDVNVGSLNSEQESFLKEALRDASHLISRAFKIRRPYGAKGSGPTVSVSITDESVEFIMSAKITSLHIMTNRPLSGILTIDRKSLKRYFRRKLGKPVLRMVILHELLHILGFSIQNIPLFINPDTLERIHYKPENFKCYKLGPQFLSFNPLTPKIDWDIACNSEGARYHWAAENTLRVPQTGECKGAPLDPNIKYSETDVQRYLNSKKRCPLRIVTPKVADKAREMFPTAKQPGVEFQVYSYTHPRTLVHGGHWTDPRLKDDLMHFDGHLACQVASGSVSPLTLAFLEDSGWYRVDHSLFAPEGAYWDYLQVTEKDRSYIAYLRRDNRWCSP